MSFETAKIFLDKLFNDEYDFINSKNTDAIVFDFIGGEPLLEIELIEQIIKYSLNTMIRLKHPWLKYFTTSMCSNGLLYNTPKVQKFFKKYGHWWGGYSVSVDGNKELHDKCRIDCEGNPTYDIVINNVKLHNK